MKPTEVLKTYFGYDTFRRGQEEIIEAILRGRDALAIMPVSYTHLDVYKRQGQADSDRFRRIPGIFPVLLTQNKGRGRIF